MTDKSKRPDPEATVRGLLERARGGFATLEEGLRDRSIGRGLANSFANLAGDLRGVMAEGIRDLEYPLTSEEQGALVALLNYCEVDEREHYEATEKPERAGHVYEHIKTLRALARRLAAAQRSKPERRGGKKR